MTSTNSTSKPFRLLRPMLAVGALLTLPACGDSDDEPTADAKQSDEFGSFRVSIALEGEQLHSVDLVIESENLQPVVRRTRVVNVANSTQISALEHGLPAGSYRVSLSGTLTNHPTAVCGGSVGGIMVVAGQITHVDDLVLVCTVDGGQLNPAGGIDIDAGVDVQQDEGCPKLVNELSISPLDPIVGSQVALIADALPGLSVQWSTQFGSIDPTGRWYTCPAEPGVYEVVALFVRDPECMEEVRQGIRCHAAADPVCNGHGELHGDHCDCDPGFVHDGDDELTCVPETHDCSDPANVGGPDSDGDTIPDLCDLCPNGDDRLDQDGDGVPDACDTCDGDNAADADGDGTPDACDLCTGHDDALDADADGVPDGCDQCAGHDDNLDSDGDGIPNGCDTCSGDDTADADGDGVPDACDLCEGHDDAIDSDADGVPDGCDVCDGHDDAIDDDGDGVPNGCDSCVGDDTADADGDGVADDCDVCAGHDDAVDSDADGVADGCDVCDGHDDAVDDDGDGVPNGCDTCAGDDTADADGDGVPDACDVCDGHDDGVDSDGDGVADGCDVCEGHDDNLDIDGDGIPDGCDPCRYEFRQGHADIWVETGDPDLTMHIHADVDGDGTEDLVDPEEVCIIVPRSSFDRMEAAGGRPNIPSFDAVGVPPGAPFWVLPQTNTAGEPFLGLSSDGLVGQVSSDSINFRFLSVDPPAGGELSIYEVSIFAPSFLVSTARPDLTATGSNEVGLVVPGHAHHNWTFSQPGQYDVQLQVELSDPSDPGASQPTRYRFIVEE